MFCIEEPNVKRMEADKEHAIRCFTLADTEESEIVCNLNHYENIELAGNLLTEQT